MSNKRNFLFYARCILAALWVSFISVILFPVFLIRFKNKANNGLYTRCFSPVARKILGIKVEWSGREIIDAAQPCVFVMNHQSNLDLFSNAGLYPDKCVLIAKKAVLFIPFFGLILYLTGTVFIKRENRKHALAKLKEADQTIKNGNYSVWIMPEGTRSYDKGLGKFKKGAFHMAISNQIPIVPVVISSYYKNIDLNKWKAGKMKLRVLEPIPTTGLTVKDVTDLLAKTRNIMFDAIEELDRQIAAERV